CGRDCRDGGERRGRAPSCPGDDRAVFTGRTTPHAWGRQRLRRTRLRGRSARLQRDASYRAERYRAALRDRRPNHTASWVRCEPAEAKAHRGAVWLGQDDRRPRPTDAARRRKTWLQVHADDGGLRSDPNTEAPRSDRLIAEATDPWTTRQPG